MNTQHYLLLKRNIAVISLMMSFVLLGCGDRDDRGGPDNGDRNNNEINEATGMSISLKADLSSSAGLLTTDSSNTARQHVENAIYLGIKPNLRALSEIQRLDSTMKSTDDESNLKKVNDKGEVSSTMEAEKGEWAPSMLIISSIGISPNKDVYLHFERNFIYRASDDSGDTCDDPWSASSPCSCQLFKLNNTLTEWIAGSVTPEFNNMECIDNEHRIDQWQQTGATFQFDSSNYVYYMAGFENADGTVLYKVSPTKVNGKFTKTEMVNRSICIRDWRVTNKGGLFYVGENCVDGNWSGEGAFFRYVSPTGTLTEIARNWWDYNFEPIEGATGDQVLFYGPDPDSSAVAQWDSACLFKFDPALTAGSRATKLVTCNQHIWDWLELRRTADIETYGNYQTWNSPPFAWRQEYSNRCLNDSDTFIGGSSGSPVKNIVQDSSGKAYIVGDISKKNAGAFTCGLEIKGNHCTLSGVPAIRNASGNYTNSSCTGDGGVWNMPGWCDGGNYASTPSTCTGTWKSYGQWYNDIKYIIDNASNVTNYENGHICQEPGDNSSSFSSDLTVTGDNDTTLKLKINHINCTEPSSKWTTAYKGMAYVNPTTNMLDLKSVTSEQVTQMWLVNDSLYYSSYAQKYLFMRNVDNATNTTLLTDFEVYHAGPSPRSSGWLLFDGLDFTNNSYSFGDLNPTASDVKGSIIKATGLSGRIKSMVIYGGK
jgi:hypothetical protein